MMDITRYSLGVIQEPSSTAFGSPTMHEDPTGQWVSFYRKLGVL
jgi:hypothetical protein